MIEKCRLRKPALAVLAALAALAGLASPASPLEPELFVLPHAGRYIAYATNADADQANVQMAISKDLVSLAPL